MRAHKARTRFAITDHPIEIIKQNPRKHVPLSNTFVQMGLYHFLISAVVDAP